MLHQALLFSQADIRTPRHERRARLQTDEIQHHPQGQGAQRDPVPVLPSSAETQEVQDRRRREEPDPRQEGHGEETARVQREDLRRLGDGHRVGEEENGRNPHIHREVHVVPNSAQAEGRGGEFQRATSSVHPKRH